MAIEHERETLRKRCTPDTNLSEERERRGGDGEGGGNKMVRKSRVGPTRRRKFLSVAHEGNAEEKMWSQYYPKEGRTEGEMGRRRIRGREQDS